MGIRELDTDDSYSRDLTPQEEQPIDLSKLTDEVGTINMSRQKSEIDLSRLPSRFQLPHLILNSFIIAFLINGLSHLFLPSVTASYLLKYTQSSYLRSQGLVSLTLGFLSLGIKRTLRGDLELQSTLSLSLIFYCATTLSNMSFAITSQGGGAFDSFGWISCILHFCWLLGLVEHQQRGSILVRYLA
jgi:hypothetical protein